MEVSGPHYITVNIFGLNVNISESVVVGWILIAIITAAVIFLTAGMKKVPGKRQAVAEMIVTMVNNLVRDNMGEKFMPAAPYIAALFAFSMCGSLVGLFGFRPMTADFSVILTWALVTFLAIQILKLRKGPIKYLKGFTEPVVFMTPLNVLSEVFLPISLSFRHFGNIGGGMVISMLVYYFLGMISTALGIGVPLTTIGIPAVLSVYFDLFSSVMQAFIFVMLTMVNVSMAAED